MQLNGVSRHAQAREDLNERNSGVGLQYSRVDGRQVRRYMGGTLINSMSDRTWYAGAALAYRLREAQVHVDVGAFLGALTYPSAEQALIAAALPTLTIGTERVALNLVYIPGVGDKTVAATLLQLTLRLH